MTRWRSEPVWVVRHLPKGGLVSSSVASGGMSPAVAAAAKKAANAKTEVEFYDRDVKAGSPGADVKLAGALERLQQAEAELAAARAKAPVVAPSSAVVGAASAKRADAVDLDLSRRVLTFEYQDVEAKTDLLKLSLDNSDLALLDHPALAKGSELYVAWGYAGNLCQPRRMVVQKFDGWNPLAIEAQDKGVYLQKEPRSRVFEQVRRSDVVRALAFEHGYAERDLVIDDTVEVLPAIHQVACTDAQLIRRLADLEGYVYFVDAEGLHFHRRRTGTKPVRRFVYALNPGVGDIIGAPKLSSDAHGSPGAVTAKGRDPLAKKDVSATATAANTPRDTTAANQGAPAPGMVERVDPRTGQTTIVPSSGADRGTGSDGATSASAGPTAATSAADAKRQAAGAFVGAQQASHKLDFDVIGDPSLAAKVVVQVDGIGKRLSGRYYVTEVVHKIAPGGYTCSLKTRTDGSGVGGAGQGRAAVPNKKDADPDAVAGAVDESPPPLRPVEVVDPRTGQTKVEYRPGPPSAKATQ